jgi:hypothetical protein
LVERELAAGVLSELDNGDGKLGHQATSDELHALIRGLVDSLPPAGSDWSNEDCANWLQAAAFNLRLIYKGIGTIKVEAAN